LSGNSGPMKKQNNTLKEQKRWQPLSRFRIPGNIVCTA
jgi:hypothetical protein